MSEAVAAKVEEAVKPGGICWNEISSKSMGGTELMCRRVETSVPKELMDNFQIIPSRVMELDESKIRILYAHDLPQDPESQHLKDGGWRKFHKIVFVSQWQKEWYVREFQIPYSRVAVLQNAITPIEAKEKPDPKKGVNLIYHTTPHRGLDLLYPIVDKLSETFPDLHLDVYSSFNIYGWPDRDKQFEELFEKITAHKNMSYHGYQENEKVREALSRAHIFTYPNTWMETSCLSMMEAMSAGCACVHPDLGALAETAANWTMMYPFHEDRQAHALLFYSALKTEIESTLEDGGGHQLKTRGAADYANLFYNWKIRSKQWENLLRTLLATVKERGIEKPQDVFTYRSTG
jgi:glycosyltransferase involved in cell wall biosynthesis